MRSVPMSARARISSSADRAGRRRAASRHLDRRRITAGSGGGRAGELEQLGELGRRAAATPGSTRRRGARRGAPRPSLCPPTWIGIVAAAGRGRTMQSVNWVNSPWCVGSSLHRARRAATCSSVRAARSANGTPMAANSSASQPMPIPRIIRPPDRWSSVASSLARTTGLRWGRIRMPVARRMRVGRRGDVRQPDQRVGDRRVLRARASFRRRCTGTSTRSPTGRRRARPSTATRSRCPRPPRRRRRRRPARRTVRCWRRRSRTSRADARWSREWPCRPCRVHPLASSAVARRRRAGRHRSPRRRTTASASASSRSATRSVTVTITPPTMAPIGIMPQARKR